MGLVAGITATRLSLAAVLAAMLGETGNKGAAQKAVALALVSGGGAVGVAIGAAMVRKIKAKYFSRRTAADEIIGRASWPERVIEKGREGSYGGIVS